MLNYIKSRLAFLNKPSPCAELPDKASLTRFELEEALDFLISLEPNPESLTSEKEFEENYKKHAKKIEQAKFTIRKYGEQIQPRTLENMQKEFYALVNSGKYRQSSIHQSVVYTSLNYNWDGIGPWGC